MMSRRAVIARVAAGLLLSSVGSDAQQPSTTVPRVGVLFGSPTASWVQALRDGLRDAGYVEGRDVIVEWRSAEGRYERLPDLVRDLIALRVDVIVAHPTPAVKAAKEATSTIPIVMPASADPIGTGLVDNLSRPSGNITGSTFISSDLNKKRLQLLKECVPRASLVGVLWNSGNPAAGAGLKETEVAAHALDVKLLPVAVRHVAEIADAFTDMGKRHLDALFVIDDPTLGSWRTTIIELARRSRLPAMYGWRDWAVDGGLMSYGANVDEMFRRAASIYVHKLLKGAKPADLPIEQPTKFELVINLKTAKALGLTIPPSLLLRADEVIQ